MKTLRPSCVPCAIDRSDVVLMVINAEEGFGSDKRIAGFACEAGKGMIIVVNKWDTIEKATIP